MHGGDVMVFLWHLPNMEICKLDVCVYMCAHICMHIYACAYMRSHICVRIYACAYVHAHMCVRISVIKRASSGPSCCFGVAQLVFSFSSNILLLFYDPSQSELIPVGLLVWVNPGHLFYYNCKGQHTRWD